MLTLHDSNDNQKMEIASSDSSTQQKEVQSDNVLSLSFTSFECVSFEVGDYVDFCGERFWAIARYTPKQISTVEWEYSVQLFGIESLIKQFLVINNTNGDYETEFSYTATAYDHVALIVACINAGMGTSDWKVGEVVASEYITIDYEGIYCDEGLRTVAERKGVEYWIDGTTVNVCRCEHSASITLGYGNGLTNVYKETANNVKFFTRLFPIGTTRNIVNDDYGHSRLQLPNGVKYLDQDVDKFGVVHHYEKEAFAHIYPHRVGTISNVRSEDVTGEDGNPFTIYYFKDVSLNFDPNDYEIGGLVKTISFQDGSDLAGRDFEVNFNSTTKEFEIITQWPYDNDIQLPNEQLCLKIGDKYILWNVKMPIEYYALAEAEYKTAVDEYMADQRKDVTIYKAHTDYIDIDERGLNLTLGQRVRLEHAEYFPEEGYRDSRITKITRKVVRPTEMDIEISDILSKGALEKVNDSITTIKNYTKIAISNLPDVIKSWESTPGTDTNLYSAKKCIREFLSRVNSDTAQELITFLKGIRVGGNGSGFETMTDGTTRAIVDRLYVKVKAVFEELETKSTSHVGGELMVSPAAIKCTSVEELEDGYKCYFVSEQDGVKIENDFTVGTLAQSRENGMASGSNKGNRYYWRKVIAVGENYITLSKNDCLEGSDVPMAEDDIVGFGHATDTDRQAAIVVSSSSDKSPSITLYDNISDFSLTDKESVAIYKDRTTGVSKMAVYGDFFAGSRNGDSYIEYNSITKKMVFKGSFVIQDSNGEDVEINTELEKLEASMSAINSDSTFSINEKLTMRTEWEQISGRSDVNHTPEDAGGTGSYKISVGSIGDYDVDITALTTAYQALLDLFAVDELALYVGSNTDFTRSALSDALSTYYAAESAVRSAVTALSVDTPFERDEDGEFKQIAGFQIKNDAGEVVHALGYDGLAMFSKGNVILDEDSVAVRGDLFAEQLWTKRFQSTKTQTLFNSGIRSGVLVSPDITADQALAPADGAWGAAFPARTFTYRVVTMTETTVFVQSVSPAFQGRLVDLTCGLEGGVVAGDGVAKLLPFVRFLDADDREVDTIYEEAIIVDTTNMENVDLYGVRGTVYVPPLTTSVRCGFITLSNSGVESISVSAGEYGILRNIGIYPNAFVLFNEKGIEAKRGNYSLPMTYIGASGSQWYRKWDDGRMTCYGLIQTTESTGEVIFPATFKNAAYSIVITGAINQHAITAVSNITVHAMWANKFGWNGFRANNTNYVYHAGQNAFFYIAEGEYED